ncbi:unnamed protein product [Mytilus edulis]|uniref:Uncharacterized protein n=1 Tax=Mytilus edulis TaxID=6550 RepID=A0A8S3UJG6_MYTED|nr:unnamed protein product [Mytilus edulis]
MTLIAVINNCLMNTVNNCGQWHHWILCRSIQAQWGATSNTLKRLSANNHYKLPKFGTLPTASSSFSSLKQEAEIQQQHIYRYTLPNISQPFSSKIDRISLQLYPEQDVLCQGFLPMKIYGDGNCLCRTGSMYIFGSENNHIELRARVVVEMALQKDWYLVQDKGQYAVFSHASLPSDPNSSDGYERATKNLQLKENGEKCGT